MNGWMNKSWGRWYFSLSDSTTIVDCLWLLSGDVLVEPQGHHFMLTSKSHWLKLRVPVWTWDWFDVNANLFLSSLKNNVWHESVSAGKTQQASLLPLWWDLQSSSERRHQTVQGAPLSLGWLWAGAVDVWGPWQELPSLSILLQQSTVQRHEKRWVLSLNGNPLERHSLDFTTPTCFFKLTSKLCSTEQNLTLVWCQAMTWEYYCERLTFRGGGGWLPSKPLVMSFLIVKRNWKHDKNTHCVCVYIHYSVWQQWVHPLTYLRIFSYIFVISKLKKWRWHHVK